MSDLFEDLGVFHEIFQKIDFILVPAYILAHTYFLYGIYWSALSAFIYIVGSLYFESIFVTMMFISYFASDLLINQRILRSSDESTRGYATIALTIVILVFLVMTATGGIEPYQAAIVFLLFYMVQARYRTSQLTMAKISEISEKKIS